MPENHRSGAFRRRAHLSDALVAVAVIPPGNIARELNLFRRGLFSAAGDPSVLAFPDVFVLGFFGFAGADRGSAVRAVALERMKRGLGDIAASLPARLSSAGIDVRGDDRFLGILPSPDAATALAREMAADCGLEPAESPPFEAARGFFLGNSVSGRPPPEFSFSDMQVALFLFEPAGGAGTGISWTIPASVRRRTGPARRRPPADG